MTKQKQKSSASPAKPKSIPLPNWWAGLNLDPRWRLLWDQLHQETPEQLRKRIMGQVSIIEQEREKWHSQEESGLLAWLAEKQDLQKQIADLEDRIRRSRQTNVFGMLNGITNCLEGNARAVHALAESMPEVLAQLAKDMALDRDRQGHKHNSQFDRGKIFGGGRGWGKSDAMGRQFGMQEQYAKANSESGIPKHWPQPPTRRSGMKPGLSQADLAAVDQEQLQEALDRASAAQEAYQDAIREIEIMIGMDTDEMGFESDGEMLGYAADGLIMHAQAVLDGEGQEENEEEESEGMIRLRG